MNWMGNKLGKDDDGYTIIFLLITALFLYVSFFLLLATKTEWKDIYAGACSVGGGVIGGLITLEGVKRTVLAQKEQEEWKLIPQKLIYLHKLDIKENQFYDEYRGRFLRFGFQFSSAAEKSSLNRGERVSRFCKTYRELKEFMNTLQEKEIEFIEVVSQIDIELYREIRSIFKSLDEKVNQALRDTGLKIIYHSYSYKEIFESEEELEFPVDADYEIFLKNLKILSERMDQVSEHFTIRFSEFSKLIEEKLKHYGQEM